MSGMLNEKFVDFIANRGLIIEAGDPMPTVSSSVIPGGSHSAPGQVNDAQTRGGAKDPAPTVTTQAVTPYHQSITDLGGPEPDGDEEGEDNPGAKASAPISQVSGDPQQRGTGKDLPAGEHPKLGSQIAYGTSEGPNISYPIKPSFEEVDLSSDVAALTEGEDLSEDFKIKAKTIFEGAVTAKLKEEYEKLAQVFEAKLQEQVEVVKQELAEEINGTLNYAINTWVEDNQVGIDRGLRNEITEDFIAGFINLCKEHWINIPEEKSDLVEDITEELCEMEQRLNQQIERNIELNNRLIESTKLVILNKLSEGLADTQKEKLTSLTEGVSFESADKFAEAVKTLKESYFPNSVSKTEVSDETPLEGETVTPAMATYLNAISRWK